LGAQHHRAPPTTRCRRHTQRRCCDELRANGR
jgi:hypothetical protein